MKVLSFTSLSEKPDKNGIIPLTSWRLNELLDMTDAPEETRMAFSKEKIMLYAGGWQSWSPGWELAPGETLPSKVRLIPLLRKLSAPPWDVKQNGNSPKKNRGEVDGSFIMYLRALSFYVVIAVVMNEPEAPPVCFSISKDREHIRSGIYLPGGIRPGNTDRNKNLPIAELRVFCADGYFALKDELKKIYSAESRFQRLLFLGSGSPGIDFRPGGYASWYNHYTNIDESTILSDLNGLIHTDNLITVRYLREGQPVVFQIDDGWEIAVGDWEIHKTKFPRGLKGIAEQIENAGLIPGIWLAPFLITRKSRIFREKPEWLLRENGRPVRAGWNPHWDGVFYCLDLSRDDVKEYLRFLIHEIIDQWGFRYIKLDFLYAGFLPGTYSGPQENTEPVSPAFYYKQAVELLTEKRANACGLPVAYLGCGLPLGSSYRHFPLSRIGTDTKERWDWTLPKYLRHEGRPSALLSLRDTIGRSFMNGTVYINDPDVIFLRSQNCSLTENEKELIALVNFLFAGQILCSDDFFALHKTDLSFAETINELYSKLSKEEYGALYLKKDVYRLESRSGKVSGIINLSDIPYLEKDSEGFSGGQWLVDRRLKRDGFIFAPRSISIYRH